MSHFTLQNLPFELKQRTASFLCPRDAIQLSKCCRSLHSSLALSSLQPPRIVFSERHFIGSPLEGDRRERDVRLPVLQRRVHSLTLQFRWRDQGWGNRKGQVWIVGRPRNAPIDIDDPWWGGSVVCEASTLAPHQEEECRMTFVPKEDEVYHLFYKVGSGGGHQLFLRQGVLHTILFDDEQRNFATNYRILRDQGALPEEAATVQSFEEEQQANVNFYPELLIRVCKSLRAQLEAQQTPDAGLSSFFDDYSIPVNEDSLSAVEEILQADLEERRFTRQEQEEEAAALNREEPDARVDGGGMPMPGMPGFDFDIDAVNALFGVPVWMQAGPVPPGAMPPWMGGGFAPPPPPPMGMNPPFGPMGGQGPGRGPGRRGPGRGPRGARRGGPRGGRQGEQWAHGRGFAGRRPRGPGGPGRGGFVGRGGPPPPPGPGWAGHEPAMMQAMFGANPDPEGMEALNALRDLVGANADLLPVGVDPEVLMEMMDANDLLGAEPDDMPPRVHRDDDDDLSEIDEEEDVEIVD